MMQWFATTMGYKLRETLTAAVYALFGDELRIFIERYFTPNLGGFFQNLS